MCFSINRFKTVLLSVTFVFANTAVANTDTSEVTEAKVQWLKAEKSYLLTQSEALLTSLQNYRSLANSYCLAPDMASLSSLKTAWQNSYQQWLVFDGLGLGPLQDLRNVWLMSYFPDKKDQVGRQLTHALAEPNTSQSLNAVQSNLRAHEALLFDEKFAQQRCEILPFAATKLEQSAFALDAAWKDWAVKLSYNQDAQRSILASYRAQLGWMRKKMQLVVNEKNQSLKPMLSESWRSQQSTQMLRVQSQLFVERSNALFFKYALDNQSPELEQHSRVLLQNMVSALPQGTIQNTSFEQWINLLDHTDIAYVEVEQQWAKAQGLAIGFNNNDGD
ncbi:hypothetical protein DBZ36_20335 [Alginatibacterium sediminis]|uniref:Imelysin-like domain-containing protein n=1 Tax=Alginatibacterium sediminis TaxID=2164068 RepID=A0A420E5G0_9ALTE|nr:imelysin family protein [Alginatibacterium sediminis]RKF12813.1 hypothetical protein DBZ36_20335 [Alginatibacterium sediminis]